MSRAADIVIDDAEFLFAESVLLAYAEGLSDTCFELTLSLTTAVEQGIQTDEMIASVMELVGKIDTLRKSYVAPVLAGLTGSAKAFIQQIDDDDQFIY